MSDLFNYAVPALNPDFDNILKPSDAGYASGFHRRLVEMISSFEEALDEDHEVGAALASFGTKTNIYIDTIGYYNPSLIVFHGVDAESRASVILVQHVSQINVLLARLKKRDPTAPARRIGFLSAPSQEDGEECP